MDWPEPVEIRVLSNLYFGFPKIPGNRFPPGGGNLDFHQISIFEGPETPYQKFGDNGLAKGSQKAGCAKLFVNGLPSVRISFPPAGGNQKSTGLVFSRGPTPLIKKLAVVDWPKAVKKTGAPNFCNWSFKPSGIRSPPAVGNVAVVEWPEPVKIGAPPIF